MEEIGLKTFQKIMDGVAFAEKIFMAVLLCVISVVTLGRVISRFTPTVSWSFTEELVLNRSAEDLLVWLAENRRREQAV